MNKFKTLGIFFAAMFLMIPAVDGAPSDTAIAVTGVSCRQQISHFSTREPHHVVEYLAAALAPVGTTRSGRPT